jgi:protein-S-isoprenylcysteine O-methyltransferase Ste14
VHGGGGSGKVGCIVLVRQMERTGHLLFRYRNHIPLVLIPVLVLAMGQSEGIDRRYGDRVEAVWESLCVATMLAGFLMRCLVVGYCPPGSSGRNSRAQCATALNTRGLYSVMRHPLYVGNLLIAIGAVAAIEVWWLAVIVVLAFALYYERIVIAEEAFLEARFGDRYREWAARTPAFVPAWRCWYAPRRAFSLRRVVANETATLAQIVVAVTLIELGCDWAVWRHLGESDAILAVLAASSLVTYVVVRGIRKKTRWLSVTS